MKKLRLRDIYFVFLRIMIPFVLVMLYKRISFANMPVNW